MAMNMINFLRKLDKIMVNQTGTTLRKNEKNWIFENNGNITGNAPDGSNLHQDQDLVKLVDKVFMTLKDKNVL